MFWLLAIAVFLGLLCISQPVLAQDQGPVFFIDDVAEITHGPPLTEFEVEIAVKGDPSVLVMVALEISDVESPGDPDITAESLISAVEPSQPAAVTPTQDRIGYVTFKIKLNPELNRDTNTYSARLIVTTDAHGPIVKRLNLTSGRAVPNAALLSPKIIIITESCQWTGDLVGLLCGSEFEDNDVDEKGRPFPEIRRGNQIMLQGLAGAFIGAAGTVVDGEGQGRLILELNEGARRTCRDESGNQRSPRRDPTDLDKLCKDGFEEVLVPACSCTDGDEERDHAVYDSSTQLYSCANENARLACEYRIGVWGSPRSGKYEGTFYLDATDKKEGPSIPVTVLVKEHWSRPLLVLLLGMLVSALLAWYFGPEKKRRAKRSLKEKWAKLARDAKLLEVKIDAENFGKTPAPELLASIDQASKFEPIEERLAALTLLFHKFKTSYKKLRGAELDYNLLEGITGCAHEYDLVKKSLAHARGLLWTADDDKSLDGAEDAVVTALMNLSRLQICAGNTAAGGSTTPTNLRVGLGADITTVAENEEVTFTIKAEFDPVAGENCLLELAWDSGESKFEKVELTVPLEKGRPSTEIPFQYKYPTGGKCYTAKVLASDATILDSKEIVVRGRSVFVRLAGRIKEWWTGVNSRAWYRNAGSALAWLLRVAIVALSGMYVVYVLEPTFGAPKHFLYAFLWGATGSVAVNAIASLLGEEKSILSSFAGLSK